MAWNLATCPYPELQDPKSAVTLAQKAVQAAQKEPAYWNTLGAAQYRAGDWQGAVSSLHKSMDLTNGGDSGDWFLLAMAYRRLGNKEQAKRSYDKAVQWMDKHKPEDQELRRFRAEAQALISGKEIPTPQPELVPLPKAIEGS
jgi:uncharacterized protein HemY